MVSHSEEHIESLRQLYTHQVERKGNRDYIKIVHSFVEIHPDGQILRKDGNNQHYVWFGRLRNVARKSSSWRINASLFGASQKYTEDELVAFRRAWLKKNPDLYRLLEIDGEVMGFIFAIPLPKLTIDRALALYKSRKVK